jgi:hypothetical protein
MVETIWDWMLVFYAAAALAVAALLWIFNTRTKYVPPFPKEWVCDCCGQVCTHLKDGLCVYCDKTFTPTSQKPLP